MSFRRVIRPVPLKGLESVPNGTLLVDGHLDYITESLSVPADAVYLAEQLEDKSVVVLKDETVGKDIQAHTFAGWPVTEGGVTRITEVISESVSP